VDKAHQTEVVRVAIPPMTAQQEQELGREIAAKVIAYFHLYSDSELTRYVNLVGAIVTAQSEHGDLEYHFAVLDSDAVLTLSAPGG